MHRVRRENLGTTWNKVERELRWWRSCLGKMSCWRDFACSRSAEEEETGGEREGGRGGEREGEKEGEREGNKERDGV